METRAFPQPLQLKGQSLAVVACWNDTTYCRMFISSKPESTVYVQNARHIS
jgi:hypothetical protein